MSASEARKVVGKAVRDETFRNQLFSDPDAALAGYDLTADEKSALRGIPAETLDDFANNLDDRISMSLINSYFTFAGPEMASGPAIEGNVPSLEAGPALEAGRPNLEGAVPSMESGPSIEGGAASFEGEIPSMERGPSLEGAVPSMESGPSIEGGGASFEGGVPGMESGPSIEGGAASFEGDVPNLEGATPSLEGAGAEITGGARNENWITRLVAALGLGGASSDDARKFY